MFSKDSLGCTSPFLLFIIIGTFTTISSCSTTSNAGGGRCRVHWKITTFRETVLLILMCRRLWCHTIGDTAAAGFLLKAKQIFLRKLSVQKKIKPIGSSLYLSFDTLFRSILDENWQFSLCSKKASNTLELKGLRFTTPLIGTLFPSMAHHACRTQPCSTG